jgi:HSP20 family protein
MLFDPFSDPRLFAPFHALRGLQRELERNVLARGTALPSPLALQLFTRDDALLLRAPLAGVDPKDVTLEVDGDVLTLAGQFTDEPEAAGATARHLERPRGRFSRTLQLPFEVDAARVVARLEHGLLEVELPRLHKQAPVKIQVLSEARKN